MDDMTRFEDRFEHRIRAFAMGGIRSVDSAAVARAVALGHPRRSGAGRAVRRLGFTVDRRSLALALALGLLVALVGGALLVGARLLLLPPSPLGDRLAHLAYSLEGDIYLADWDGGNPVRIADGDPGACDAYRGSGRLVSPDGRHLGYRSSWSDTCRGTVYIADRTGLLVASFPGVGWNIDWSPDSTRVATWIDSGTTIGIYGIDGTLQAVLDGSRMCCGDYDPVWSPDGAASILVKEGGWGSTVWELPVDGAPPRPVPADDPRSNMGFGWQLVAYSPDRTRVAFIVYQRRERNGIPAQVGVQLVVAATDGTQRQVPIEAASGEVLAEDLMWSPTGERIAYVVSRALSFDWDGSPALEDQDLRLVDPRTGTARTLTTARGTSRLSPLGFSPEGDRILFRQSDQDDLPSLWSVNIDGTSARMLVSGADAGGWMTSPADAPSAP